jgi:hypothetical protein
MIEITEADQFRTVEPAPVFLGFHSQFEDDRNPAPNF